MFNSQTAASGDLNLASFSAAFKREREELRKGGAAVASGFCHHHQQLSSSLMRYRSAPSSLLANIVEGGGGSGDGCDDFLARSASPEAESMFARFMSCAGGASAAAHDLPEITEKQSAAAASSAAAAANQRGAQSQFIGSINHDSSGGFGSASPMNMYQSSPLSHSSTAFAAIESSYRNSMATESGQMKGGSNCSNLIRHSSSPAGLFSHLTAENGYVVMRGVGNYRGGNGANGRTTASASRFKNQMSLLSRQTSSPGQLSQISEMGTESISASGNDDGNLGSGNSNSRIYIPGGFPISSWEDDSVENFSGLKRMTDGDGKMVPSLNTFENQGGQAGNQASGLTHQFSLPKTSSEMAAMEKFLYFQDSVPCKIRAKRGCATHPRSIAERVRRTRISERMRKLQELVPNMDKQTNTADMLDLAVDYIKDLQRQVKTLSEIGASCTCSSKQKQYKNPGE